MSGKMMEVLQSLLIEQDVDMEAVRGGISEETKLREDLGLESDSLTDFIIEVEEKYDISISDDAVEKANTIADLMGVIQANFE